MNGESSLETYTLTYVKQVASGNLLYSVIWESDSGNSNWGSVTTQRGRIWQEVEGRLTRKGTYVYLRLIHVDVWKKSTEYCNYPSIKNNEKIGKKQEQKNLSLVLLFLSTSRLQATTESPPLQKLTVHTLSSLLISSLQIPHIASNSGSPKQLSIFLPKSFFVLLWNHT